MAAPRVIAVEELARRISADAGTWDALWRGEDIGRIAVAVVPNAARLARVKEECAFGIDDSAPRPEGWDERWRGALVEGLHDLAARMQLPGDYCPALAAPRFVHFQSQGIADLFGARVEERPDGNCFAWPLPPEPSAIDAIEPRPVETSVYWRAVEWTRYARAATRGLVPFRNAVMTGPIDTANYLLGSTTLLEWLYTHPETVRRLLDKITRAIVAMTRARLEAAGGVPGALHFACTRGGFDLCSEVRSLLSAEMYEAFEAPCLARIGDELGDFAVHSCGSWERTLPSVLANRRIRGMNGQVRENDLAEICRLAQGRILLSIGPSVNVHARYTWPDTESFHRHVLGTVPEGRPFEVSVGEDDLPSWRRLHRELRGREAGLGAPRWTGP